MQGGHQVAQKLIIRTLPCHSSMLRDLPLASLRVKLGICDELSASLEELRALVINPPPKAKSAANITIQYNLIILFVAVSL